MRRGSSDTIVSAVDATFRIVPPVASLALTTLRLRLTAEEMGEIIADGWGPRSRGGGSRSTSISRDEEVAVGSKPDLRRFDRRVEVEHHEVDENHLDA
jgi:hypothetical protein